MSDEEILQLIREAVTEAMPELSSEVDKITFDTALTEAGLDSVALLEAAAFVEEKLDADFPDDKLAHVETVSDLASLVREHHSR